MEIMSLRPAVGQPRNPALRLHAKERRAKFESRLADLITRFAGSMDFVYPSIIWHGLWIALPVEEYPFGLLTMIYGVVPAAQTSPTCSRLLSSSRIVDSVPPVSAFA